MRHEIASAVNYLCDEIWASSPAFSSESTRTVFCDSFVSQLSSRYEDHWFPAQPHRGCAFRRIERSPRGWDSAFDVAAESAGVEISTLMSTAPPHFTIWIDPGEVYARIGAPSHADDLVMVHGSASSSARDSPIIMMGSSVSPNTMSPPHSPSFSPPSFSATASLSPNPYLSQGMFHKHQLQHQGTSPIHNPFASAGGLSMASLFTNASGASTSAVATPAAAAHRTGSYNPQHYAQSSHSMHPSALHSQYRNMSRTASVPTTSTATATATTSSGATMAHLVHQQNAFYPQHMQQQMYSSGGSGKFGYYS